MLARAGRQLRAAFIFYVDVLFPVDVLRQVSTLQELVVSSRGIFCVDVSCENESPEFT